MGSAGSTTLILLVLGSHRLFKNSITGLHPPPPLQREVNCSPVCRPWRACSRGRPAGGHTPHHAAASAPGTCSKSGVANSHWDFSACTTKNLKWFSTTMEVNWKLLVALDHNDSDFDLIPCHYLWERLVVTWRLRWKSLFHNFKGQDTQRRPSFLPIIRKRKGKKAVF